MRDVNPAVEKVIQALSPRNIYGQPIFRAIWSPDVLHWVAGWWNDYDKTTGALVRRVYEARKAPRYQMAPRWVIEKWCPPEFFGAREMWETATEEYNKTKGTLLELGPYPHEGMYMHIWTCETRGGKYCDLTPTVAEEVVQLAMLPVPSVEEMYAEAAVRDHAREIAFEKSVDNILGDPFPFLGRQSNITPSSLLTKLREERKRGKAI